MTFLEDIVETIEQQEDSADLHFSLYSIPYYFNEEEIYEIN